MNRVNFCKVHSSFSSIVVDIHHLRHHHFQLLGWAESKITIRFWIIAIVMALLSLATLKLQ